MAILSSPTFNAPNEVDATSLTFRPDGHRNQRGLLQWPEELNGDGLLDMACHFNTQSQGFCRATHKVCFRGRRCWASRLKARIPFVLCNSARFLRMYEFVMEW